MTVTTNLPSGFKSWSSPSYNEIHEACQYMARHIRLSPCSPDIDLVVGVARGGLLPAVIISHMLAVPMRSLYYSSKSGKGDNKDHSNTILKFDQKHLLLVDDLTDTGHTMKELRDEYINRGHTVTTAVVYYKQLDIEYFVPDIWAVKVNKNFGWINFPFEVQI